MCSSVGAKKEKQRSPYDFVLTDGMHSIRLSKEDQSYLEGGSVNLEHLPLVRKEFPGLLLPEHALDPHGRLSMEITLVYKLLSRLGRRVCVRWFVISW